VVATPGPTFREDQRLNSRLSSKDLEEIQNRALAEGLPYQALISSLFDKYASGRFKGILTSEVMAARCPEASPRTSVETGIRHVRGGISERLAMN